MAIKFGTGGFRAIIGEDFTKENIRRVCQAISNIIKKEDLKKEICIGYDNRFLSEQAARWCAEVFAGNDIMVELFDSATSTPVVMYATKKKANDYGVMITASHNPYMYNGIKIFVSEGRDADVASTQKIEAEVEKLEDVIATDYETAKGEKIIKVNYLEEYVDSIVQLLDLKDVKCDLKVLCDTKHGSTAEELNMLFDKIGIKKLGIINRKRDAFFGFELPAPAEENVAKLRECVVEDDYDIGFALDADGDRLAVIDRFANYIDNNCILSIVYYFLCKYCGKVGPAVKNVATSNMLDRLAEKLGQKCIEVPVGFKYVSSALVDYNAVVGGESSGGLAIHGHIWGKDSLLAIALCIKAMIVMQKPFDEILADVKEYIGGYDKIIVDKQYGYTTAEKKYIDKVLWDDCIVPAHKYDVDHIVVSDYIKVYYTNGNWSLVRFSGTEPVMRIFAEADTRGEADEMIQDWKNLLNIK